MRNRFLPLLILALSALSVTGTSHAATPEGAFVFSGKGAMLLTFDAGGAYSGVAAFPQRGVVNISGTLSGASGTFEIRDRFSNAVIESGTASGESTSRGFRMILDLSRPRSLTFIGTPRAAGTLAPSGQFSAPLPPTD